ncbi:hypothetical protein [Cellulomonas fimi]|uniref:DUF4175 domain-containing protein n=1 Tax=Cellulomonas fimi TaxID=1708 RepID=A0A7Y0LX41_CELFI|nr:hypothetical protein [Cellulomonas fimi]NMR19491.1 DUF4175 domain-containing protein [Cellulomonas fimi]
MGLWCTQPGPVGWVVMLAFWITVIVLVLWGLNRLFPDPVDADRLLDARLAAGEIDLETYRVLRSELSDADAVTTKGTP